MGATASVPEPSRFHYGNYSKLLETIDSQRKSNENNANIKKFDVFLGGHSEAKDLLNFLEVIFHIKTTPNIVCTNNITMVEKAAAVLVALSPHSWECDEVHTVLREAIHHGKRICFVHIPLNDCLYSKECIHFSHLEQVQVDLGKLLSSVPAEFSTLFEEIEVISFRNEFWVLNAVSNHIIESLGYLRRINKDLSDLISPLEVLPPAKSATATDELALISQPHLYEGYAYDQTDPSKLLGWYQIISQPIEGEGGVVDFQVHYHSLHIHSFPSFSNSHQMHITKGDSHWNILQMDPNKDWYHDDRFNASTTYFSRCEGFFDIAEGCWQLRNHYRSGSGGGSMKELSKLFLRPFLYHFALVGVNEEIADTLHTFANVLEDRAVASRKPRTAILSPNGQDQDQNQSQDEEKILQAAVLIFFITPSVWKDERIAGILRLARQHEKRVLLLSQIDPRLVGHCNIPEVMKEAPSDFQSLDVLPFYRRIYEQNALLDQIFTLAGFPEAIPLESNLQDMWKTSSLDFSLMESKLLSKIDLWTETNEGQLLEKGNWIYYEGSAQRGGDVWGWYQLDGVFNDDHQEFLLLINYQCQHPRAFPSYMKVTSFDWNPSDHSFQENTPDGHWYGHRDEEKNLIITNKFGDRIVHRAMPFVYHFFLSHIQRECTDLCAFVNAELIKISKNGKKIRCWFDQKASQINKQSMYNGIHYSAAYILFLSPSIWKSIYVLFELSTAKQLRKPILLIYNRDRLSKSFVELEELMAQAPPEHANLLAEAKEVIEYHSSGDEKIQFMKKLLFAGGFADNLHESFF